MTGLTISRAKILVCSTTTQPECKLLYLSVTCHLPDIFRTVDWDNLHGTNRSISPHCIVPSYVAMIQHDLTVAPGVKENQLAEGTCFRNWTSDIQSCLLQQKINISNCAEPDLSYCSDRFVSDNIRETFPGLCN